jgi:hypothetical protein
VSVLRRRRKDRLQADDAAQEGTQEPDAVDAVDSGVVDGPGPADDGPEPETGRSPSAPAADRGAGPWDVSERPETEGYVDLGAVRVRGREGMELRLEVEEATGRVTAATVQLEGSAVQLQVFAAPRTEGIWDEIRAEIATGVTRQGGTADEVPGGFGRELIARIPVRTADGRTGHQPARFVGVNGPRWFLRAVFHGPAVHEPAAAQLLESVVRDVVVVRGSEAMAPRELLPLRLPDDESQAPQDEDEAKGRSPLEPFRRGPEITEIH